MGASGEERREAEEKPLGLSRSRRRPPPSQPPSSSPMSLTPLHFFLSIVDRLDPDAAHASPPPSLYRRPAGARRHPRLSTSLFLFRPPGAAQPDASTGHLSLSDLLKQQQEGMGSFFSQLGIDQKEYSSSSFHSSPVAGRAWSKARLLFLSRRRLSPSSLHPHRRRRKEEAASFHLLSRPPPQGGSHLLSRPPPQGESRLQQGLPEPLMMRVIATKIHNKKKDQSSYCDVRIRACTVDTRLRLRQNTRQGKCWPMCWKKPVIPKIPH